MSVKATRRKRRMAGGGCMKGSGSGAGCSVRKDVWVAGVVQKVAFPRLEARWVGMITEALVSL